MYHLIEHLEGRQLFASSATIVADLSRVVSDGLAIAADVRQSLPVLLADARTVSADLRSFAQSSQGQPLVTKLKQDDQKWIATLRIDGAAVKNAGAAKARVAFNAGLLVFRHPTNFTYIERLGADLLALGSAVTAPLATLQAAATSGEATISTDLQNIAAAASSDTTLQAAIQQVQTDAGSAQSTIDQAGQQLQTDVGTLVSDLTGT